MGNLVEKKKHICVPDFATYAIRQAFLDGWGIRRRSYRAVVDRVAPPAHDVQDVVCSVHFAVNAVQDCVVCTGVNRPDLHIQYTIHSIQVFTREWD